MQVLCWLEANLASKLGQSAAGPKIARNGGGMTPEARVRKKIDALLMQAGWQVCNMGDANIHAAPGLALREFPLNSGYGFADYLLCIHGQAAGVIEAEKEGATLTAVEVQSTRYVQGLPASVPA